MMYENDKLNIPEEIKRMSVSEIRYEKEKIYEEIKKNKETCRKKIEEKKSRVTFSF